MDEDSAVEAGLTEAPGWVGGTLSIEVVAALPEIPG